MSKLIFTCSSLGNGGRLGNQLFTIFSTIGIASKYPGSQVVFPEWAYQKYFKLTSFVPGFEFGLSHLFNTTHIYHEPNFHYTEFKLEDCVEWKKDDSDDMVIDLKGYFQSPKYWEHIKDDLLHCFEFEEEFFDSVGKKVVKFAESIHGLKDKLTKIESPESCSMHLRFGDYVNNPYYFSLLHNSSYYEDSINHIHKPDKKLFVFVFSDNVNIAEGMVNTITRNRVPKEVEFVFIPDSFTDIESLMIMSKSDHNIIANSSFSWWAAYLNKNHERIITAPKNWFAGEGLRNNTKDLFYEGVILI